MLKVFGKFTINLRGINISAGAVSDSLRRSGQLCTLWPIFQLPEKICPVCSEFDQYSMIKSRKVVEISLVKIYNERQRHEEKMYKMKADLK